MSRRAGWHIVGGRARYWDGTQWVGGDFDPQTISADMLADSRGHAAPSFVRPPAQSGPSSVPMAPPPAAPQGTVPRAPSRSAAEQALSGPHERSQAPSGKPGSTQITPAGIVAFVVAALFMLGIFMDIG